MSEKDGTIEGGIPMEDYIKLAEFEWRHELKNALSTVEKRLWSIEFYISFVSMLLVGKFMGVFDTGDPEVGAFAIVIFSITAGGFTHLGGK